MESTGKDIFSTWKRSIKKVIDNGSAVPTERQGDAQELLNYQICISSPLHNIDNVVAFDKRRGIYYDTVANQKYWATVEERLMRFISRNGDVNQIEAIQDRLKKYAYNRQAYATIWSPEEDTVSTSPYCILGIYFFIREGCLNMTALMRSNDAWGQALNDIYHLVHIQKKVAEMIEIPIGAYTHYVTSYHIYISDLVNAKKFIE